MTDVMPGAEPFVYDGGQVGCLLLHGFTGTPQEMRRLAEFLHRHGFSVRCPLLAGHGTHVETLSATSWRDWHQSTYQGWTLLRQSCTHTFAIGQSLGGALALHLAAHVSLSGVVAVASPLVVDPKLLWLARLLKHLLHYRRKGPSNILDPQALAARVAYDHTPIAGLEQSILFLRHLLEDLLEVHRPVLLIHSRQDKSVSPQSMPRIYERLGTQHKGMMWLENSGHIVTEDLERERVYAAIEAFIEAHI